MKTITGYISTVFTLLVLAGCSEKELAPISASQGKPQPVTVDDVASFPGGARISYTLPQAEDLLLVKAEYVLSNGRPAVATTSYYNHTIDVEGFNDTGEHEVLLYTVNRAQETSEPVRVTIQPEESPLQQIVKSMQITPDFGGARFSWNNPSAAPVTIEMMTPNSTGVMGLIMIYPTSSTAAHQSLRGYEPEPRAFAAIIRDKWGNASDTLYPPGRQVTPIFEEKIPFGQMQIVRLLNDGDFNKYNLSDSYMIDGDLTTFAHNSAPPSTFTIDLGSKVMLSRFRMWYRQYQNTYFCWGNPRYVTIYGRVDAPSNSGDWSEWTKIMDCEAIKLSGLADQWKETPEDVAAATAGIEFEFEFTPTYRYIRVDITETWGATIFAHPAELSFWGKMVQ